MECRRRPNSVWTRCPCPDCRRHMRRMNALRDAGRLQRVPSDEAWDALDSLLRRMSLRGIAEVSGVQRNTLRSAVNERRMTGRRRRLGPLTAARLVRAAASGRQPSTGYVNAVGTRRRLRALAWQAWSAREIAERTGLRRMTLQPIRKGETTSTTAAVATAIRDFYDKYSDTDGGDRAAERTARDSGWEPPAAWDDETIDDPATEPWPPADDLADESAILRAMDGFPPARLAEVDRDEAILRLTAQGVPGAEVADRIGISQRTVERTLYVHRALETGDWPVGPPLSREESLARAARVAIDYVLRVTARHAAARETPDLLNPAS